MILFNTLLLLAPISLTSTQSTELIEEEVFFKNYSSEVSLDELIKLTREQLEKQIALKKTLEEFKIMRKKFNEGLQSKQEAAALVKTAKNVLKQIDDLKLQYIIDQDTIDDLHFLSSLSQKKSRITLK